MQGKRVILVVALAAALAVVLPLLAGVQQSGPEASSPPEGNGKALVSRSCAGCHSLEVSLRRGRSREGWTEMVRDMIARGARIPPADVKALINHLAVHYGTDYVPPLEPRVFVWVDREGNEEPLAAPPREYHRPMLSPDGRQVAVDIRDEKSDIWIYDIPAGELRRLTHEGNNRSPTWSHDGRWVAFGSDRHVYPGGNYRDDHQVYRKRADGSGPVERLTEGEFAHGPQRWTPDGKILSISEIRPETGRDIWMLPSEGEREAWPFLVTPHLEGGVAFSADGRWLTHTSDETGRREAVVRAFPAAEPAHQVSTGGGIEVVWPLGSKELFYRKGDQRIAVEITTGATLTVGTPRVLFEGNYVRSPGSRAYWDATQDGQRFLILKKAE